jgi:hypothetical protein
VLVGVASFIQVLVGRGFDAVQLNALVRMDSLVEALIALFAVHGIALAAGPSAFPGLGIGVLTA